MPTLRFSWPARRRLSALGALAGLVWLAGCGETSISVPLPAARVDALSGPTVSGQAGSPLADAIRIRVVASDEQPLPGVTVTFSPSAGSVDPTSAVTDQDGLASTRWTLGDATGESTLTISTSGGVSTTVKATVAAAAPGSVTAFAGTGQSAPAGAALPVRPAVKVLDTFGNVAGGVPVTFSVLAGGGHVTDGVTTTDAQGVARVGSWVLGASLGEQIMTARVEAPGVSNNPVIFTANATTPTGASMVVVAGNGQQATVGRLVAVAPSVKVRNAAGNGIPGAVVIFAVASGNGGVVGSQQVTDATGTATVGGWFLGPLPGTNTLTATSPGIDPVTFTATGVASIPVSMTAVSLVDQAAPVGSNVQDPPAVVVRDAEGTPVSGVSVTFAVTAGGGSIVGSPVTTNANGVAALTSWKLGSTMTTNTVTATATGLPTVTFNATATAGAPATVLAAAGTGQTALQGTMVATRPAVRVFDSSGNPVIGATVTFAVALGSGSATGLTQVTNTQGEATVGSWTLGTGVPNTLTATVAGTGISGNPVTFTAQSATKIGITAAPVAAVALGATFTITVQLQNALGDAVPLAGIPLKVEIASGGGTLGGTVDLVTDASGVASFDDLTVTGTSGGRTFRITGTGLTAAVTTTITFN